MMCHAKHAPLENWRSCDRSTMYAVLHHVQMGALLEMCTWIFLQVSNCLHVLYTVKIT